MDLKQRINLGFKVGCANLFNFRFPLSVYYLITYRCVFKCKYCNITKRISVQGELFTSQVYNIICEMAKAGVVKLHITGGEPMLRDDIGEVINLAKSRNIFVGISSSGYSIPNKIKNIRNVDVVFLSFEGEKGVHDYIRGKESFEILREAMKVLKFYKIKFWTTTVLNKLNINSIDYILNMAKKEGFVANFVMLHSRDEDKFNCFFSKEEAEQISLNRKDIKRVVLKLIEKKKSKEPVGTSFSYLYYILQWKDYNKEFGINLGNLKKCWAGRLYAFLEPDGMLYPCGTLHDKSKGMPVLKYGFKKSFLKLQKPYCNNCLSACQTEQNMIFSFKLEPIINWLRFI